MANEYLDLHKLQTTEIPFTVERIVDEELQASAECQLPDDNPLDLDFPELEPLPDLTCTYDVEGPLVPLPYYCIPEITGGVTITGDTGTTVTTVTPIGFEPYDECSVELVGAVEICTPTYMASLSTNVTVGLESTAVSYGLIWSSNCGVVLNGVGKSSSGTQSASPGLYIFSFSCCDGPHVISINVPQDGEITIPPTITCEDITLDWSNSAGEPPVDSGSVKFGGSIVGTINVGTHIQTDAQGCALAASYETKGAVVIDQGLVMDIQNNVSLGCTTQADDPISITYTAATGLLTLDGTIGKMCFGCDVGNDGTYVQDMALDHMRPKVIDFSNSCCSNTYGGWFDCGERVAVGSTGAESIALDASGTTHSIVITDGGQETFRAEAGTLYMASSDGTKEVDMDAADLTGTNKRAEFRELEICVAGVANRFWVLCTEPEEIPS